MRTELNKLWLSLKPKIYEERTASGMLYTWALAGPDGASFTLWPDDDHTSHHIAIAKDQIKSSQDAVTVRIGQAEDRYSECIFFLAEREGLHWSQIDHLNIPEIRKAIRENLSPRQYVANKLETWKQLPIRSL